MEDRLLFSFCGYISLLVFELLLLVTLCFYYYYYYFQIFKKVMWLVLVSIWKREQFHFIEMVNQWMMRFKEFEHILLVQYPTIIHCLVFPFFSLRLLRLSNVVRKGLAYFPAVSLSFSERCEINFGLYPFEYPIEGYSPLDITPTRCVIDHFEISSIL